MALKPVLINVITIALKAFMEVAKKKDKSNTGTMMAEWFFWDELETLAKNKGETIKKTLFAEGILTDMTTLEAGSHNLGESPGFVVTVKITEKVKTFDPAVLAKNLHKNHKVPIPAAVAAIEAARLPTGTPRKTVTILER
jgi:hypothetical protein